VCSLGSRYGDTLSKHRLTRIAKRILLRCALKGWFLKPLQNNMMAECSSHLLDRGMLV
jgi:hypothetical protein